MIEIYLLEQLIAVDECGSFNLAAKYLHLTQPTITRSMQKIEQEFGVPLFQRDNNKVTLNKTGKLAANYARKIIQEEHEMLEKVRSSISVDFGFSAPGPSYLVARSLNNEQISNNTSFKTHEELIDGLRHHKYQIVITDQKINDIDLYCKKYMTEKLYISATENHPLTRFKSVSFEQLQGSSFLMAEKIGVWKKVVEDNILDAKFLLQDSIDALSMIVLSSSLLSFSTNITRTLFHRAENRTFIPISNKEASITFYLYCLKEQYPLLQETIKKLSDDADSF